MRENQLLKIGEEVGIVRRKLLRWRAILLYLIFGLFASIITATAIGPVYIEPSEVIAIIASKLGLIAAPLPQSHVNIILEIRLPRAILAAVIGAALSLSGVIMQGLFRNPLADPYILGVSPGAALGAALSMTLLPPVIGLYTTPLAAFAGGLAATALVYGVVKFCGRLTTSSLLLAGIAISYMFSAILSAVIWALSKDAHKIILWLMGGLWGADWLRNEMIIPIVVAFAFTAFAFSKDLNALLLGEETAQSLGVNVHLIEKLLPILASMTAGAAVAFAGSIGFVGLMMPHIMRLIVGPDHRILIPSSALAGGIFLVWADTAARCLMEIPVGVITALCGVPFFIYLMRRGRM
ncbi:MAG: iron chelate uptake ABC transporter family permease subunit [Thaumarchaeota archaeon]|nr:iron chelate uptake ABC transporter family permease subunit [Nitrososphaerota archaeon]